MIIVSIFVTHLTHLLLLFYKIVCQNECNEIIIVEDVHAMVYTIQAAHTVLA